MVVPHPCTVCPWARIARPAELNLDVRGLGFGARVWCGRGSDGSILEREALEHSVVEELEEGRKLTTKHRLTAPVARPLRKSSYRWPESFGDATDEKGLSLNVEDVGEGGSREDIGEGCSDRVITTVCCCLR